MATEVEIPESVSIAHKSNYEDKEQKGVHDHSSSQDEIKKVDDSHETVPATVQNSYGADKTKEAPVEAETVHTVFTGDAGTLHGETFPEPPSDPNFTREEPCILPEKGHPQFNNAGVIETGLHQRELEEPICNVKDESSHEEATAATLAQYEAPAKDCPEKEVETGADAFDGDEGSGKFLSAKTSLTEDLLDEINIKEEQNEVEAPSKPVVSKASETNENEGQAKGVGEKIPSEGFITDGVSQPKSNDIESDETTLGSGNGAKDAVDSPPVKTDKTGKEFEDNNDIDCPEKVETPVIHDASSEIESVGVTSLQEEETDTLEKTSPTSYVKGKDNDIDEHNENIPSQIQVPATTEAFEEDTIIEYPEQTILQLDDPKEAKLETSLNNEYLKTEKSEQDGNAKQPILQYQDNEHLQKEKSEQYLAPEQTILQLDDPKEEKIDRCVDKEHIEAESTEPDGKSEHTILPHDVDEHIEKKKTELDDALEQTILQHDEQKEDKPATYTDEIYPETAKSEQDDVPDQTILQHGNTEENEPTPEIDEAHLETKTSEQDVGVGKTILHHDEQIEDKPATYMDVEHLETEKSEKDDGSEKTILQHDEQIVDKPATYTDEVKIETEKSQQDESPEHINLQHDVPKDDKLEKSLDSETKETVGSSETVENLNTVQEEIPTRSLEFTEHRVPTEEIVSIPNSDKPSSSEELGIPEKAETELHVSDPFLDDTKQANDEILHTPHVHDTSNVSTESQMLENTPTQEVMREEISTTRNVEADQPVKERGLGNDNKPEEENGLEVPCNTMVTEKISEATGAIENEERERGDAGKIPSEGFTDDAVSEPQPNDIESDETTLATGVGAKDIPDAPLYTPSGGGLPEKEFSDKVETPTMIDGVSETESPVVKSPQEEQTEFFSPKSYIKGKDDEIDDQNEHIPSQIQALATTEAPEEENITEEKPTFPPQENIENIEVYNDEKHIEKNKAEQDDGPKQTVLQHDDPKEVKLETSLNKEYLQTEKTEQDDGPEQTVLQHEDPKEAKLETSLNEEYLQTEKTKQDETSEHPTLQNEDTKHFEKEISEQDGVPAQTMLQQDEPKEEKLERSIDEEQIQAENKDQIDELECTILPHDNGERIENEKSEHGDALEETILPHDEQREDKPAICTDDERLETERSKQEHGLEGTTLQHDKQKEDTSATDTDVQSIINKEEVRDGPRTAPSEDVIEPVDSTKRISQEAIEQAAMSSHDEVAVPEIEEGNYELKEAEKSKEEDSNDHKREEGNYTDQSTYAVAVPEIEDYQHIRKEAGESKEEILEEPETMKPSQTLLPETVRDDEILKTNYDAGSSTIHEDIEQVKSKEPSATTAVLNVEEGLGKETNEAKIDEYGVNETKITKQGETESLVDTSELNERIDTSEPEVVKTERGYNFQSKEETDSNNSKEIVQEVLENPEIAGIDEDSDKHSALEEINISSISPEFIGEETLNNSKHDVEEEKRVQVSEMIGAVDEGTVDTEKQTIEEESVIKESPKVFETDTTKDTREQIKEESDSSNKHTPEAVEKVMPEESCKQDEVIEESAGGVSSANNKKHEHATPDLSSLPVAEEGIDKISTECETTEIELNDKVEDSHLELKEKTEASEDPQEIIKETVDTTETLDILNRENTLDSKEDNESPSNSSVLPVLEKEDYNEILEKGEPSIYDSENSSTPEVATLLQSSKEAEQEDHKQATDSGLTSEDSGLETTELKGIESSTREFNVEPEETSSFGVTRDIEIPSEVIGAEEHVKYAKSDTESADGKDNLIEPEVVTDNSNIQSKNNEDPFIEHKEKSTSLLTEHGLTSQKIDTELASGDTEVDKAYNELSIESQENLSVPPEVRIVKDISGPEDLKISKEEGDSVKSNIDNEVHLSNFEDHKSEDEKPPSEASGHVEALDRPVNKCEESIEIENSGVKFEADTNDSAEEEKTVEVPPETSKQVREDSDTKEALILNEENLESVDPHHSLESATQSDPGAESPSNTSPTETSATKVEGNDIQYQNIESFQQNLTKPELQDGEQDIVENEIKVTQSADETVTDAILAEEIPTTLEKVEEKEILTDQSLQGQRDAMETGVAPAGDETVDETKIVAKEAEENITEKRNIIEHQNVRSVDEIDNKDENSDPTSRQTPVPDDSSLHTKSSHLEIGEHQSEQDDALPLTEAIKYVVVNRDGDTQVTKVSGENDKEEIVEPVETCVESLDAVSSPVAAGQEIAEEPQLDYKPRETYTDNAILPSVTSYTSSGGEGSDNFKDEQSLNSVTNIPSAECLGVVNEDLTMDNAAEKHKGRYEEPEIKLPVEKSSLEKIEKEPEEHASSKIIEKGEDENINEDTSFGTMASDVTCLQNEEPRELDGPKPIEVIQHDTEYKSLKEATPIPEDSTLKPQDDVVVKNFDQATSEENIDPKSIVANSLEDNIKDEETFYVGGLNKKDDSATTQLLNEGVLTDPDSEKVEVESEVYQTKDLPLEASMVKLGSGGTAAELENEKISEAIEKVEDNKNVPEAINEDKISTGNVTINEVEESALCSSENPEASNSILPLESEKKPTKGAGDLSTFTVESNELVRVTQINDGDSDPIMLTELSQENINQGDDISIKLDTAPVTEETKEGSLEGCQSEDKHGEDLNDIPKPIANIETRQEGRVKNLKFEETLDSATQIPVLENVGQERDFVDKQVTAENEDTPTAPDAVFDHKDDSVNELEESVRSLQVEEPNVEVTDDKMKNESETISIKKEGIKTEKSSDPKTTEEACSYNESQIPALEHDNVHIIDSSIEKQETSKTENSANATDAFFEDKDQRVNEIDESVRSLPKEDHIVEGPKGETEHGHETVSTAETVKQESINKEESVTPQKTEDAEFEVAHLLKGIKEWQNESKAEENDTPTEQSKVIPQEEIKHEHESIGVAESIKDENILIEESVTPQTREDACLSDEASRELEVSKLVEGIRNWQNESVVDKNDTATGESKVTAQEDLPETSGTPVTALNTKENQTIENPERGEKPSHETGESGEASKEVCQKDELMVTELPEEKKKEMQEPAQYEILSEELPVEAHLDSIMTTPATNEDTVPKYHEPEGVKIKEVIAKSDPENDFDSTDNKKTEQVTRDLELDLDTSGTKYNEEFAVPTNEEAKKDHDAPPDSTPSTEEAVAENICKTNKEASGTHPTEPVHDIEKEFYGTNNQERPMESEKIQPVTSELASDGIEVKEDQPTPVSIGTFPRIDESPQEKILDEDTHKHVANETYVPTDRKTIDDEKYDMEYKEPTRKIDMELDEPKNDEKILDIEDAGANKLTEKSDEVIDIHDSHSAISTKNSTPDLSVTKETDPGIQKLEKAFEYPSESRSPSEVKTDESKVIAAAAGDEDVLQKTELEDTKPITTAKVEPEVKAVKCDDEKTKEKQQDDTSESTFSLSNLPEKATRDTLSKAEHVDENKEQTQAKQEKQAEKTDTSQEEEEAKTDEDKRGEKEGDEHKKEDSGSDGAVMVEASKDIDAKVSPKKSHGILSGVGLKVKHSISKVKKAITGKSSHSKALSPK